MSPATIAYLDCFSGVAGNMLLGALLDAGVDQEGLLRGLAGLGLAGYSVATTKIHRNGIAATRVRVSVEQPQAVRRLPEIQALLQAAALSGTVKAQALAVFAALAQAEATVHGCAPEEIHFHEVGAVDALIDIVGVILGLESLGVRRLHVSPLPMPRGWVDCGHGTLPLPAPAVVELLRGMPVTGVAVEQELVTPTGAALVRVLADDFGVLPAMRLERIGYGAGSMERADGRPNLLRLVVGPAMTPLEEQEVVVIETNIDDGSPELFPYLHECLGAAGALDVSVVPIQMKKGRPGFLLRVIAPLEAGLAVQQVILSETTAIGLRYRREARLTLERAMGWVATDLGRVRVKRVETPVGSSLRPEYEQCRLVAKEHGVSLQEVYGQVARCRVEDFVADPDGGAE